MTPENFAPRHWLPQAEEGRWADIWEKSVVDAWPLTTDTLNTSKKGGQRGGTLSVSIDG